MLRSCATLRPRLGVAGGGIINLSISSGVRGEENAPFCSWPGVRGEGNVSLRFVGRLPRLAHGPAESAAGSNANLLTVLRPPTTGDPLRSMPSKSAPGGNRERLCA